MFSSPMSDRPNQPINLEMSPPTRTSKLIPGAHISSPYAKKVSGF